MKKICFLLLLLIFCSSANAVEYYQTYNCFDENEKTYHVDVVPTKPFNPQECSVWGKSGSDFYNRCVLMEREKYQEIARLYNSGKCQKANVIAYGQLGYCKCQIIFNLSSKKILGQSAVTSKPNGGFSTSDNGCLKALAGEIDRRFPYMQASSKINSSGAASYSTEF